MAILIPLAIESVSAAVNSSSGKCICKANMKPYTSMSWAWVNFTAGAAGAAGAAGVAGAVVVLPTAGSSNLTGFDAGAGVFSAKAATNKPMLTKPAVSLE